MRWALRRRGDLTAGVPAAIVAALAIALPIAARFFAAGDRLSIAWAAGALAGWGAERVAARGERAGLATPTPLEKPQGEEPPLRPQGETRRRVDALLAKIQAGGVDSLTKEERDFLSQASREFRDGHDGE
jgi:hypothetical protein